MPRFIATIVLTVFAIGNTAACTVEQYQELMLAYTAAAADIPTDGSITNGEQFYDYLSANFTDAQKQYPCLACLQSFTIDQFTLEKSTACISAPMGTECQNAQTNIRNAFIACSMDNTNDARVMISGVMSVLLIGFALLL
jgi:hypothetical protein